jgi:hypothetical protein
MFVVSFDCHRVKPHKVAPSSGNELGDIEIKDYVVLPRGEDNPIPPLTLIMDVTMSTLTHNLLRWRSSS